MTPVQETNERMATELYGPPHPRSIRRQLRRVPWPFWVVLVSSAVLWLTGCATVRPTAQGRDAVFAERKGGVIAAVITNAVGSEVDAITLPTHPPTTVYLRDSDAPDLRCHEADHQRQIIEMGQVEFTRQYLAETLRHGYWNNRFEEEARMAQEACLKQQ